MKNILFVERSGILKGGGQVSLLELVRRLDQDRYHTHCRLGEEGPLKNELEGCGAVCSIHPLPQLRLMNVFAILSAMRSLIRYIRDNHIHLIHSNDSRSHVYAGIASRLTGIPCFFHYRVSYADGLYDRLLPRLCTHIAAVSHATAKRFPGFTEKLFVVHNGVDTELFSPGKTGQDPLLNSFSHKPLIGSVGRMGSEKGFEQTLQGLGLLKKEFPNIGLVLVGKGGPEEKERLTRLCSDLGIERNVLLLDSHPKLHELMRSLDVYMLLSENEGLNRSILEAMACGKPVVATAVGGNPEVIENGKTGILLPGRTADLTYAALRDLLNNSILMELMGRNSRERIVRHFSMENHVQRMQSLFDQALYNTDKSITKTAR